MRRLTSPAFAKTALSILALALAFGCSTAAAQGADSLFVWADASGGVVYLRWLPATAQSFEVTARRGYVVERARVGAEDWTPIGASPVRAAGAAERSAFVARDSAALAILDALSRNPASDAEDRRDAATFAVLSTIADRARCRLAGLCAEDQAPAGDYRYRVTDAFGNSGTAVTARALPPPLQTTDADFGRGDVRVDWPKRDDLAYYYLERRIGDTGAWTRVTDLPSLGGAEEAITLRDSLTYRDSVYAYRVEGFTYTHLSVGYGPEVSGFARGAQSIPRPNVARPEERPDGTVAVSWTLDPDGDPARVERLELQRAFARDSGYVTLETYLGGAARAGTDELADGPAERYYRVRAYDALGRYRTSVPVYFVATDTTPPPPPTELIGEVGRDGVVRLTWTASEAPDLLGYRVFYSLRDDRPGTRLTPYHEPLPAATDTLDLISLPDTVWYRVVAIDQLKNASAYSEPVGVALPDVHVPIPPVLAKAEGDTTGVRIGYVPSVSPDATTEEWQRRREGTRGWYAFAKQAAATGEEAVFFDETASADFAYEYRVVLYDDAGLRAISNVVAGERTPTVVMAAPADVEVRVDEVGRGHELSWTQGGGAQPDQFRIYRASEDGELTTYLLVDRSALQFKRRRRRAGGVRYRASAAALLGGEHAYAGRGEWGDGRVGKLSEVVKIGK